MNIAVEVHYLLIADLQWIKNYNVSKNIKITKNVIIQLNQGLQKISRLKVW